MTKKLTEMSIEELWRLFPITLSRHKSYWGEWYALEAKELGKILPESRAIYHIGSTAIKGIAAKPIVDILAVFPKECDLPSAAEKLQAHGYLIMSKSADRISLNKGYTENGYAEKVFHLHLQRGAIIDEVYFRDWLNLNADAAREYEALKLSLWKKYEYDRDAYTQAKSDFVNKYTEIAKRNIRA